MDGIVGKTVAAVFMYLLAIAAFPPACFSSFIAANSFKTTLPKVNPFISCGIGTLVAIILAVTGYAGNAVGVFKIIGASFGPVCGAMAADYLLAGKKWAGPRAGFNPAGWISWLVGFAVGAADFIPGMAGKVPCPPVAAFIVGFRTLPSSSQGGHGKPNTGNACNERGRGIAVSEVISDRQKAVTFQRIASRCEAILSLCDPNKSTMVRFAYSCGSG